MLSTKKLGVLITCILYACFFLFYLGNRWLLNWLGLEPRLWVTVTGVLILALTPFILSFILILWGVKACRHKAARFFSTLGLITYVIISLFLLLYLSIIGLFRMENEQVMEDGRIQVTISEFPGPSSSYLCNRAYFFARRPIPGTKRPGSYTTSDNRSLPDPTVTPNPAQPQPAPTYSAVPQPTGEALPGETPGASESGQSQEMGEPEQAAQLIYDQMFSSQGKTCSFQYNAKGNLYLDLGSGTRSLDGETVTTRETLAYDRISKNGECCLFVHYEEHYDSNGQQLDNTSILNFYAANLDTRQVVSADKTAWADPASEPYHAATGEY